MIVGVSSGEIAGARMIESLNSVLKAIGLISTQYDLKFPNVKELFDESGNIKDQEYIVKIDKAIDDLVWLTEALKIAREKTSHRVSF